jgi:deoxyadenosine/deoxycytidine kinase
MNLDDNELFIYQRLFDLLARDLTAPDLVIYLQTPTDLLKKRIKERARRSDHRGAGPSDAYIAELNEAYNHFFFHYTATPLLVVETTQFDVSWGDDALDALLKQIQATSHGTRYYVPRT